jgi:hypothetical protein
MINARLILAIIQKLHTKWCNKFGGGLSLHSPDAITGHSKSHGQSRVPWRSGARNSPEFDAANFIVTAAIFHPERDMQRGVRSVSPAVRGFRSP